ncbi:MAG: response regulator transcription factor [Elusimicrobia bacterium]|nr:response regulator transcription factor [Elusimicrobiota bacterium]
MASPVVWIVNANALVSDQWVRLLGQEGWAVHAAANAERLLASLAPSSAGLVLIDEACLAPGGGAVIEGVKARAAGVSVVLTAQAALSDDQVIALLEAGADDFFPPAMPTQLLLAKLRAHLRRMLPEITKSLGVAKSPEGDLVVDKTKREVSVRSGARTWMRSSNFTSTEIDLLSLFLNRPGEALNRQFIIDAVWQNGGEEIRPGTIDKHVESIRRKLGRLGARIQSVYGIGYAYRSAAKKGRKS